MCCYDNSLTVIVFRVLADAELLRWNNSLLSNKCHIRVEQMQDHCCAEFHKERLSGCLVNYNIPSFLKLSIQILYHTPDDNQNSSVTDRDQLVVNGTGFIWADKILCAYLHNPRSAEQGRF